MPVKIILRTCIFIIFFCVFANANETVIEIENPKFTEKGINEKVYEIKASKGLQSEEKIDLINIEGKFRTESGVWIYLTADNGLYKRELNQISLQENVHLYTAADDSFHAETAVIDIEMDTITFDKNIKHTSNRGVITANKTRITSDFNKLVYEGNVKTKIIDVE